MPRECPELVGQPLGWDMFKVLQKDGSETLIERAISINDICPRLGQGTPGQERAVICFFTDQKHGPSVTFMNIVDIENQLLSEKAGFSATTVESVRSMNDLGKLFLDRIEHVYGASSSEVAALILS